MIRGRLEMLGPKTSEVIAEQALLPKSEVEQALLWLENDGFVFRGRYTKNAPEDEWCERRILARIHRYTLHKLRREIEPVPSDVFMRFLFNWQGLGDKAAEGKEALANAIDNRNLPILDIGCGTGLSGLALREKAFQQIDGCDLSAPMLEIAKQCGCYRHLFETDLNQPPINVDPHTYAGISAVGVFSFGHVAPDAMDEFLRVLVPGGKFVVGINDHYYSQGDFTAKLKSLKSAGLIRLLSEEHGVHLKNIEGSTGWVIVCEKISEK